MRSAHYFVPPWLFFGLAVTTHAATEAVPFWPAPADPTPIDRAPINPTPIDTVSVEAPRPSGVDALTARGGCVTVIPLGASAPATRDLADLLDRTVGIDVRRIGGPLSFATASVRGSSAAQVKVCLDGVPLATASSGAVNLAFLPVACLAQAEVYRGAETALVPGAPAAGVVQLRSAGTLRAPVALSFGGGSFGYRTARAQGGWARGAWGLFAAGSLARTEGDFPYLDRNGTLRGNTTDDRTVRRSNNDAHEGALLAKGSRAFRQGRVEYTAQRYGREGGVPGTENLQTEEVRLSRREWRHQLALLSTHLEANAAIDQARERFDNRSGEVGLGRAWTEQHTRTIGGSVTWKSDLPGLAPPFRLFHAEEEERLEPRDLLTGTEAGASRRHTLTSSASLEPSFGRVQAQVLYRWVRARDRRASATTLVTGAPVLGHSSQNGDGLTLGARLDLGRGFSLKSTRGAVVRFPTFAELFGQGGIQSGNPELEPERGLEWDVALAAAPRSGLQAELTYFERIMRDEISLLQNSQRTVKAWNLDRAWVRGSELRLFGARDLPARVRVELQAHGTSELGRDVGASHTYPRQAPAFPFVRGTPRKLRLGRGAHLIAWEITARSATFRDRYNTRAKRTPGATLHDARLEVALRPSRAASRAWTTFSIGAEDLDGFRFPAGHSGRR
ncbi:MAG: TonB-dependent receptor [Candidatus Eisenbacteria bacterium]